MEFGGHRAIPWIAVLLAAGALSAQSRSSRTFQADVQPILSETCRACHNDKLASGGLDLSPFLEPSSLTRDRDGWERIAAKLRLGEMPPSTVARPSPEKIAALLEYLDSEFDRMDRGVKPDPGRVVAHRLNRREYVNTVRDLLGVNLSAEAEFPPDDSGYGFDNIGDVLTVSPTLMERYLAVAERADRYAVGGDPLPAAAGFFSPKDRVRRISPGAIELEHPVEYDADYVVRVNLTGHRGDQDKPVTLSISIDGKSEKTATVPVQISAVNRQGGATQRSIEEVRLFLEAGAHLFRADFVNDDGLLTIPESQRMNNGRNIYPDTIEIAGPFPPSNPQAATKKKILVCDPDSGNACVDRILIETARRAYRKPVARGDIADLRRVFDKSRAAGYNPRQSLQFAVTAMLVSPHFLFRIERDPRPGTVARITDIELASRLSYFLWSSMPDDELLTLAEKDRLRDPAVLDAQVRRMIASPKATSFAENFTGQWLETRSLDAMKPDAKLFPEWGPELRDAMRTETRLFFEAMLRENRELSDFIDGKFTFLNERLASHYGIAGVTGPEFRRVTLTDDHQRSGVFTQGSVLTVTSYPTRTSVVLRGKYLLENVLNAPAPPPPPNVPPLNEEALGVAQSLRQRIEQHRENPLCASCHARMDPLGFALENYDAIGKWRTQDGKFPVDASGAFPNGKSFIGHKDMKELLKQNLREFAGGLAEKMLTYSLGRGVESYDRPAIRELVRKMEEDDFRFQTLITGIVRSVPFQQRRAEMKEARQ
jgi:hypothetical protein